MWGSPAVLRRWSWSDESVMLRAAMFSASWLNLTCGNDRQDRRIGLPQPGDHYLVRRGAELRSNRIENRQPLICLGPGILSRHGAIRPGISTLQENRITDQRHISLSAIVLTVLTHADLGPKIGAVSRTQVGVTLLHDIVLCPAVKLAHEVRFRDPPHSQVTGPDRSHLSRSDQPVKRLHRLLYRRLQIIAVGVVKIDPIRLQALQALLTLALDLHRRQTAIAVRIVETKLGIDDDVVAGATILHPQPERRLAFAAAAPWEPTGVEICCVDEIATLFPIEVQQSE